MNKDIVDLIKAQGNQACVMIPGIIDTPSIDLGKVTINEGDENIELSTDQKQQLIDFINKHENNDILEVKITASGVPFKMLMKRNTHYKNASTISNIYAANPVSNTFGDLVTIYIFVITFLKAESITNVIFGVKQLK